MKPAILSSSCFDGAGRAAYRLHLALRETSVESDIFVRRVRRNKDEIVLDDRELSNKLLALLIMRKFSENIKPGNTISSLPPPCLGVKFLHHFDAYDVINLHWIANFIPIEAIGAIRKPVVWTLHDQNPFTGGCHYTHGCEKYIDNCDECPQIRLCDFNYTKLVLSVKKEYFPKNITIVSPSKWLADCARKSALFKHNRIEIIPNSLETDVFKPYNKEKARRTLNLPVDSKIVMFGAAFLGERRKGAQHFIEAIRIIIKNEVVHRLFAEKKFIIVTCGEGLSTLSEFDQIHRSMGSVSDDALMAKLYSAADVFVLPSEEDNLPNTMLESFACGTPVVAFRVGGMADTIIDGQTGYLAEPFDSSMLAEQIIKALHGDDKSETCREYALKHFRNDIQASRYTQLFEEVIASYREDGKVFTDLPIVSPELSRFMDKYTHSLQTDGKLWNTSSIIFISYTLLKRILIKLKLYEIALDFWRKIKKHSR